MARPLYLSYRIPDEGYLLLQITSCLLTAHTACGLAKRNRGLIGLEAEAIQERAKGESERERTVRNEMT